jgi:hypothetical protein
MVLVGFSGLTVAYASQIGEHAVYLLLTLPYFLLLAIVAFLVSDPKKLAAWFFAIHTVAAAWIICLAHLMGEGGWGTALFLYIFDFPVALFFYVLFDDELVHLFHSFWGITSILVGGGLPWSLLGWLVARARRPEANQHDTGPWRVSATLFALHAVVAVAILCWCAGATDAFTRGDRFILLWWIDFPVATFNYFLFQDAPGAMAEISLQQAILLVAIGGAAWAILGWLVVRARPLHAAARRL